MTERLELTRRKALAGLGAVGAASVGAGLGTSAYFSDQETYEGNVLTAGSLDLRVDWEEHYSDWSDDEADGIQHGVHMEQPDADDVQVDPANFVGLPDPQNAMVYVHDDPENDQDDDLATFMANTAIEAFPDHGNNGSASLHRITDPCQELANDEALREDPANNLRTNNDDTVDENGNPKPLVSLSDVKPGDFGELTLSFHLCDNPGYVWLQGDLVSNAENGTTEPESEDPDEQDGTESGELADTIRTAVWYDEDGDNVLEPGGGGEPVDLLLVFDQSESMNATSGISDDDPQKLANAVEGAKSLVDAVGGNTELGLTYFSDPDATQVVRNLGSAKSDIKQDLDDLDGPDTPSNSLIDDNQSNVDGGQTGDADNLIVETDIAGGIDASRTHLTNSGRSGARKVMVILSDGRPTTGDPRPAATAAKNDGIEIFTIAYGSNARPGLMEDLASTPKSSHAFVSAGPSDIENVFGQIGKILAGEEVFFRGTLRELLDAASQDLGIPLDGDRSTQFDELNDPPSAESRECFVDSTTNALGIAWWLPVDHGNEVQTDSVQFDLGFYTEQCRHNSGAGLAPETPTS